MNSAAPMATAVIRRRVMPRVRPAWRANAMAAYPPTARNQTSVASSTATGADPKPTRPNRAIATKAMAPPTLDPGRRAAEVVDQPDHGVRRSVEQEQQEDADGPWLLAQPEPRERAADDDGQAIDPNSSTVSTRARVGWRRACHRTATKRPTKSTWLTRLISSRAVI